MNQTTHPFIRYGIAVVMRENRLSEVSEISREHIIKELEISRNHFRLKPQSLFVGQKIVKFVYCDNEKGEPGKGIYLSPSVLSGNKEAKSVITKIEQLKTDLKNNKKSTDITRSITPIAGEFTSFGDKSIGRGKPKMVTEVAAFAAITTSTSKKPSLMFKSYRKEKNETENIAIIPDLELPEMIDFIDLFELIKNQSTDQLMTGYVSQKDNKPQRPKIYNGNFPNAPKSSSLGAVALLAALGSWSKDAEAIQWAKKVLDSLKNTQIYLVGTKTYQTFKYNHYIIELAKANKLSEIVDSIYYTILYNQGARDTKNTGEYQKFDLFASRFLQLFNTPSFKDFFSFRAEYPHQLEMLFKTYFVNMENISEEIVHSARELGKWLNYAAYRVAETNVNNTNPVEERKSKIQEAKAKNLIEIESSIFSARSGDALIFQAITRAGRASGLDAPPEAELFMIKTSTGEISLDSAKYLLIAFSRLRNKFEQKQNPIEKEIENDDDEENEEDFSDAQE
ncbi:type I-PGING CRISPR-associated protein Cas8c/Csp2 [Cruoricaptor ignavus]|uniref:Type I-PGING CRISPR-associated protein Cas8c/Csp2 n=1 Tax=Cruoricaptor ignavus TaxID=1118202 RepID=A0A7M1T0C0_9FLAO|nr:type I-PGING CRISPR-associated protein Cas8c/Csp2 [Cruoricaptor ignavus]QOR73286.1 type I-PGING CRISPR-associated protein Cas8c/Csp2 [Cruoricaptor ignavus]